ncbi:SusC/RagA family TonB-linked outer membrane protein [Flavobacterium sp. XS2P12]|uniref:SusC/RagA family TonB-linked outer membrane protein n=1 Tax=Flavobacterium melibiosi TaxID=3398734 RepID=UPI003A855B7A
MKKFLQQHRVALFLIKALVLYLGFCTQAMAQQIIQGKVTDENNQPIVGANVLVKGTNKGTNTDIDGSFKIEAGDKATLEFTFLGYVVKNVAVGNQSTINVAMEPDNKVLNEVVVVGYGSQTKKKSLGSVQTLSAKEMKDIPVAQITQKLQGKLAGVQINQTTGKPGGGMAIRIRGQASLLAGSDPLYVVDGFPIVGDISGINPDEIENLSVLKDAASTSLYGSRAANGVVLITTKQAKKNQTTTSFNIFTGTQTAPQQGRPDLMNAVEFAQFQKEYYEDLGQPVPAKFQNPSQYEGKSTDWYNALLRTAPMQSYNFTIASNKDKLSTAAVLGIFNQDGIMINSNFKRYSLRINSEYEVSDKVKIGFNIAPSYSINNTPSSDGAFYAGYLGAVPGGLFNNAMLTWPTASYVNEDGTLPLSVDGAFSTPNWYRSAKEITNETKTSRVISNAKVQYEPIPGLVLKSTFNVDLGNSLFKNFNPSTASTLFATMPPIVASAVNVDTKYMSWLNENTANYAKSFGDHNLEVLVGYTNQNFRLDLSQIRATNFPDDRIQTIQSALNIDRTQTFTDAQEWALTSLLSRINYDYKGKYLLTAAIRRDGSSRFGSDNRWGNFPSVGAGWIISEEDFAKKIPVISFAKLKASYGIIGNNNIGNYTQYALINNSSNSVFGNTVASGAAVSSLGNSNLGWETTSQLDLGIDLGLFDERIRLGYDFYTKNTTNLLYNVAVPQESGFTNFNDNVGEIKFWGHELSLNTKNLTGEFKWTTNLNISFSQNKVLALADGIDRIYGGFGNISGTITQVGQPLGQFYGLIQDGVYDNTAEFDASPKAADSRVGTVKYKDVNGDGVITFGGDNDDRTVIGNPFPKALLGMTNTFNYKNFDLSIVCSGSFGNDIMVLTDQGTTNLDGVFNVLKDVKNRWRSEANPGDGRYGTTTVATYMERDWASTHFMSDGSYLAIKNVTLGYNIPTNGKFFKTARVYGSVQQLYTFTNYRGSNPEVSSSANGVGGSTLNLGMDWGTYPVPRTLTFGINVGF